MNSQPNSAGPSNPIFQSATEVFLGDSDTSIPMRVGHLDEGVPTLSREEFRKASLRQRQLDVETEAQAKKLNMLEDSAGKPLSTDPLPKAFAGARPSGKPSRVRRTTLPPARSQTPILDKIEKNRGDFESRIAKMEAGQAQLAKGVDRLVELLAARDERAAAVKTREEVGSSALAESKPDLDADQAFADSIPDDIEDEIANLADASVPDGDDVDLGDPEGWDSGDPAIARMQAHIQRKTPLKDFRRFWQSLCPRAGFQKWPNVMQDRFTEIFRTIMLHPEFLAQVRRTVLTFHNGECMGEEQMYKALVMLAGCCSLYSIITVEV